MARHKNTTWNLADPASGDHAQIAVLMDIRDELQQLNRVLSCGNLSRTENLLRDIKRKLPTRRRKKRVEKAKA